HKLTYEPITNGRAKEYQKVNIECLELPDLGFNGGFSVVQNFYHWFISLRGVVSLRGKPRSDPSLLSRDRHSCPPECRRQFDVPTFRVSGTGRRVHWHVAGNIGSFSHHEFLVR